MIKQTNDELANNEIMTDWVDELPIIIKEYNQFIDEKEETREKLNKPSRKDQIYKQMKTPDLKNKLLEVGQKVYVPLDKPQNVKNSRLPGKFRAGDLRYEPKPRKIEDILIGNPTVYKVSNLPHTVYTREMLILDEGKKAKPTKQLYTVEKITAKRKRNNRIEYKVKWLNYPASQSTWEPRTKLIAMVPDMVNEYENK